MKRLAAALGILSLFAAACGELRTREPMQPIIESYQGMMLANMAAVLLRKEGYKVDLPQGDLFDLSTRPLLLVSARRPSKGLLSSATPKNAPDWLKGLGSLADLLGSTEPETMTVALAKVQDGYAVQVSGGVESSEAFAQRLAEACAAKMHLFQPGQALLAEAAPSPTPKPVDTPIASRDCAPDQQNADGPSPRPTPQTYARPYPRRSIMLFGPQADAE